eukprot:scaffold168562_cov41-Prasinocladus_malaysianus.AAC.1
MAAPKEGATVAHNRTAVPGLRNGGVLRRHLKTVRLKWHGLCACLFPYVDGSLQSLRNGCGSHVRRVAN